ncbi:hypothetical protein JK358_26660 [Nocardia sp. 2]|uniref:Uncharacterized protein n=1 Tax=Nocardia acididurans TaxID=2802282 RepID=A0ABS1MCH1_9NOCA|nr:hypothetical protein [Nocardia acididurans]MBL1077991.1 hypothetical protein [Nocardia acididurans]
MNTLSGQQYSAIVMDPDRLAAVRPRIAVALVATKSELLSGLALLGMELPDGRMVLSYRNQIVDREKFARLESTLSGDALEEFVTLLGHRWDL